MFNDSVSFNGGTRVEVIAVLANCGRDTDRARRALVTWIRHKQGKGRSTEHILVKLRDIESKFIKDTSLHSAFRDARAETFLPRAPDLPLPSSVKRKSVGRTPEFVDSPISAGRSSPSLELPTDSKKQTSQLISPLRVSRDSLQMSEFLLGKPITNRPVSLPQGVLHVPPSRSPRIQIPHDRSLQPGPNSPITPSPEDSVLHLRYRYMSHPVGLSSQSLSLVSPLLAGPPEFPSSSISFRDQNSDRRLSRGIVPPPRIQIPRSRSQRSSPNSPRTSSSGESDSRSRYHQIRSMSPVLCLVTPPRTSPPDVPLPPIPSPVPGSDESENTDSISATSLPQQWQESNGELPPSDDVVRQDSPVYALHDETGIGPPPPYVDQVDTYSPPDTPTIGDALDRAVDACGGSPQVRLEVSKCIGFYRGYEPPYWQTRLQACGLNAEAVKYLVDEMSKQVDWTTPSTRRI